MSDKTGIEWTQATWNPVVGCTHVSPGCDNCYAAREASGRLAANPATRGIYAGLAEDGRFNGTVRLLPDRLDQPIRWRRPRRIFVNSMSDLFHDSVPDDYIAEVFAVMALAQRHTFQVLTKRHGRMRSLLNSGLFIASVTAAFLRRAGKAGAVSIADPGSVVGARVAWPLPNVWTGVSVESSRYLYRVDALRETPAAIRFLSCEPLIGPLGEVNLDGIGWVIAGGESGPRARPMHPDWVRSLRDQCADAGVPFYFKQWGEHLPVPVFDAQANGGRAWRTPTGGLTAAVIREPSRGSFRRGETRPIRPGDTNGYGTLLDADTMALRVGKRQAGRLLDGVLHDEYPAVAE